MNTDFMHFTFFFKDFIYLFLERGQEGETEGEKHQCVGASGPPPVSDMPDASPSASLHSLTEASPQPGGAGGSDIPLQSDRSSVYAQAVQPLRLICACQSHVITSYHVSDLFKNFNNHVSLLYRQKPTTTNKKSPRALAGVARWVGRGPTD